MSPFFFRDAKQEEVLLLAQEFTTLVGQCVDEWKAMVLGVLEQPQVTEEAAQRVYALEGEADKIRYKVERKMHKGAFLPAYREDYILLFETIDRVANKCEECAALLDLARHPLPPQVHEHVRAMVEATDLAWDPVPELVQGVLTDTFKVKKAVREIGHEEHVVDDHQYAALQWVWHESGLPLAEKMILKQILDAMGAVADRIEDGGDRINLIGIKRKMG